MYTYIIESQGLFKIGKTGSMKDREAAYKTHTAQYRVIVVYDGNYESYLHEKFKHKHSHLEWYKLDEKDIEKIELPVVEQEYKIMITKELLNLLESGMSQAQTSIYAYMLRVSDNTGTVDISKQIRIGMGKKLELNERTVLNTLGMLVEKKLIYTTAKGVYKINPRYAYKGSTYNRNRDLKVVLEVECPHC